MLEPILKGLVEWVYEMMLDMMSYVSGELLGVMSMDLSYFERTAPVVSEIVDVLVALGWALLIGNLVFQSLKAIMSGAGFEAEDPKILFLRTFVFAFLLLASRQICNIGSSIAGMVIELLALPDSIDVTTPDGSMFSLHSEVKWLLVVIVGVVMMFQMLKLLFEIGERYVITSVLTFFAPLAFAMGGSKNTNDIFKGWVRMYCSMLVMMIMNIVFLKLIMSAMSQMTAGGVIVWLVFVVALARVARKIDSHIGKIGLNPAQTGNELGSRVPGAMAMVAVRTMGSLVSKSLSGSAGTSGKGGAAGQGRQGPSPKGPRPGGGYGGSYTTNNTGGSSTVNGGTNAYIGGGGVNVSNGGVNTNVGGTTNAGQGNSTVPNAKGQNGAGFKGGNAPRPTNSPNASQPGRDSGTTINQGIQNNGQQSGHISATQQKGTTQRPPIPRGTAGAYPQGVNPMSSVVNGGNHSQGNPAMPNANGGTRKKGTTVKGSNPVVTPPVMSGGVKQTVSGTVQHGGGKTVVDTDVAHSRSDVRGTTQRGGNVSGGSVRSAQIGGNNGGVNVSGVNMGGSTQIHSEHSGGEHFTDRSSEHFRDSHTRGYTQMNTRTETTEKRVNHEYKHGRYNPAAANRKARKSYYRKDSPSGFRQSRARVEKRGEKGGKHKQ